MGDIVKTNKIELSINCDINGGNATCDLALVIQTMSDGETKVSLAPEFPNSK